MANSRIKDITGQRFGRLVVIGLGSKPAGRTSAHWLCVCDCGGAPKRSISASDLKRGKVNSCGCLKSEIMKVEGRNRLFKHGHAGSHCEKPVASTRTYRSWIAMHKRCKDPENIYYAGRGITVCARWSDFECFLADMGERPEGKTLDRINGDGNYETSNCRWATHKEQAASRRPAVRRKERACHAE